MKRPLKLLAGLGGVLVAMTATGLAQRPAGWVGVLPRDGLVLYLVFAGVAGAAYAAAVFLVRRCTVPHGLLLVLGVAGVLRLMTFAAPPLLSTDIFRYVWDGRVQAAGINPYLHLPADPALEFLRDPGDSVGAIYPHINRVDTAPTIYPPAAQALFALTGITWSSIWGMKLAMLLLDGVAIACALLLLRAAGQPAALALIYAWNPLPVWEFAGGGHIDAAAAAFSGLAMLAVVWRRTGWAGAALGVAILFKLLPAAIFPALWRRWNWRIPLACLAVIGFGYACYAGAGWRVLGYLPGYADEEGVGGHGAFLLRLLAALGPLPRWAFPAYAALSLAVLGGLAAWIGLGWTLPGDRAGRAVTVCRGALILSTALMIVLSPHYPWYLAPLALPAVLVPARSVLWLTIAAPLLYLDDWHDQLIWPALLFLPFFVLLALDLLRARPQPALAAKGSC